VYKLLLTFRYLRRKLTPLFPLVTVVLCVAMVIIVISVMGGFLDLVKNAGRTLMGDVSVSSGVEGFAYYPEMIKAIEGLPEAEAATPIIKSYGLLKLPFNIVKTVAVTGIDGRGVDRVTRYRDTLYWNKARIENPRYEQVKDYYQGYDPVEAALTMRPPWPAAQEKGIPAIVPGIEVSPANRRMADGSYEFLPSIIGLPLSVTMVPVTRGGALLEPSTLKFVAVNEFNSGVYDVDDKTVFIPFDVAQDMLKMKASPRVVRDAGGGLVLNADGTPKTEGMEPARASEVHVRAAKGVSADQLREAVNRTLMNLRERYTNLPPLYVDTWQQRQKRFLDAVENEKNLMTFLFGIISMVAVLMIAVVFYMIVLEKTRDIGILRAIGASPSGVASIFLSFGLVIGALGAGLGVLVAYLIVNYINEIHGWLGDGFGAAVVVVGIPLAAAILFALIAKSHGLIRAIFDRRWLATLLTVVCGVALLATLGTLVIGFIRRPADVSLLRLLLASLAAGLGAGVVTGAVDGVFVAVDAIAPKGRFNVLIMAAVGAAVSLLAIGVWFMVSENLAQELNRRLGFQIWDRSVYFFDKIPSHLNWTEVGVIAGVAVVSSVLGALVPALRAALLDPVETLRYE
jgi:lipoprotein-releasing system permease protein